MGSRWKTVRVFVSSTFRDFYAERDYLVKVVFPRLKQWCEARRLHLVDIDLRWGITKQEVEDGRVIDICLNEIDHSRPFFICVIGERYGWVPDELPPDKTYKLHGPLVDFTHFSITHLEVLHAAFQSIPNVDARTEPICDAAFFYFRSPRCVPDADTIAHLSDQQREEHRNTFFEQVPEHSRKLDKLKEEIRSHYGQDHVYEYSATWDAEAQNPEDEKLKGRLTALEELGDRVEGDLKQAIEEHFSEHLANLTEMQDLLAMERSQHEAFIETRIQVHVPRTNIENMLTGYVTGDHSHPLVLSGRPGSGKTATLAHWIAKNVSFDSWLAQWGNVDWFVVPRFIGASTGSTSLHILLANICKEICNNFQLREEVEVDGPDGQKIANSWLMKVPSDPVEVIRKWPQFLEAVSAKGHRVLVVLDGINQLDQSVDPHSLLWVPRHLPHGVRLVLSVIDQSGVHNQAPPETLHSNTSTATALLSNTDGWLDLLRKSGLASGEEGTEVQVQDLDGDCQKLMLRALPQVFAKKLSDDQTRQLLSNPATRNPLFLLVALEELRVFGSFERLPMRIAQLPQLGADQDIDSALCAIFGQVLQRLDVEARQRRCPGLVKSFFCLLASAREGLSELELSSMLANKLPALSTALRDGELQVVLRQVRPYLTRKFHSQGTLLHFYHCSFLKAVQTKYLAQPEDRRSSHRCIAAYFQLQNDLTDSSDYNNRRLFELPWQLFQAALNASQSLSGDALNSEWTSSLSLLCSDSFQQAKMHAGLALDLVEDFTRMMKHVQSHHISTAVVKFLETPEVDRFLFQNGIFQPVTELARTVFERGALTDEHLKTVLLRRLGYTNAGVAYTDKAISHFSQAYEQDNDIDPLSKGSDLGNLGFYYRRVGESIRSQASHQQALIIARNILSNEEEVLEHQNTCFRKPSSLSSSSQDIWLRAKHLEGNQLVCLGIVQAQLGESLQGIESLQKGLSILRSIGDSGAEPGVAGWMAEILLDMCQFDEALKQAKRSAALSISEGQLWEASKHITTLAIVHLLRNELVKARHVAETARQIDDPLYNHHALIVLGIIVLRQGDCFRARGIFHKVVVQANVSLGRCCRHFDAFYSRALAHSGLAICNNDVEQIQAATNDFEAAKMINVDKVILSRALRLLTELEQVDSMGMIISVREELGQLSAHHGRGPRPSSML